MKFRKLPERRKSKTSNYDSCAVFGCRSTVNESYNLSFHCFPGPNEHISVKNEFGKVEKIEKLKAWKTVLKISRMISPRMRVCSLHFKKTDYIAQCIASQNRYIKSNAIPSSNLGKSSKRNIDLAVSQSQLERLSLNNNVSNKKFKDQVVKVEPIPITGQWQNFVIEKVFQDYANGELHFIRDNSTTIDQHNVSLADNVNEEFDFIVDGPLFKAHQHKENEEMNPTAVLNLESPGKITPTTFQSSMHDKLSSKIKDALFKVNYYIKNEEMNLTAMPTTLENSMNVSPAAHHDFINRELCSVMNDVNIKEGQCDINNIGLNPTVVPTVPNFMNARPVKLIKDIAVQVNLINQENKFDNTKSYFCDDIKTNSELNIATGIDNFEIFNEIVEMVRSAQGNNYNNNVKMSTRQQVIMTFVKLKHKLSYSFLAILFHCSSKCCQQLFRDTLQVLSLCLINYYNSDPNSKYLRMFARVFDS